MSIRVGVAGWSIPPALAGQFPSVGTHLERYGARFSAVEINSSFYRPHRRTTYQRWAASVPPEFRFSVKLPRTITHERRLIDCRSLIERFAEETGGLGDKRGPILVQLPPSFAYPGDAAEQFINDLKGMITGSVVLEPRHASWFQPEVDHMLRRQQVSRVAADPAKPLRAAQPGGWGGLAYFRLHGSPRIYESPYGKDAIEAHAKVVASLAERGADIWTIYDNTTFGAATQNAFQLADALVNTNSEMARSVTDRS
ncbi:protein of unknown function DUF72 [Gluconacetobacter diazotrophicus PA1 5]|uniref:Uncharacterized protein n=2 Tax=Gluconacetobacter diazotrophicus TaxID=33996 RepID=A9HPT7_GLUDA|nr:DUF72 domain-containing protein [Gluconacetobacter diazotrophicus]ACI50688.1 protein of unknown function DUF72 [Gluconacetobacter diazotrophicus PA1 5]MBB2158153.1 DUF72 domain-containing protein [Gluconacetobacter diazotrophicus]TWA99902.1 uncharacterized protein YecE (DUF72 family) [Gluconacetobacter diazotrophicus]CAP56631.1 conserved hypothetical protein [Gluconacetobacter diazotrophicus PA1 5]